MAAELFLDLWGEAQSALRERLGSDLYDRWLVRLSVLSATEDGLRLGVANRFILEWVQARYLSPVVEVLESVAGCAVRVELAIDPQLFREHRAGQEGIRRTTEDLGALDLESVAPRAGSSVARSRPNGLTEALSAIGSSAADAVSLKGLSSKEASQSSVAAGSPVAAGERPSDRARSGRRPRSRKAESQAVFRLEDFARGDENELAFQAVVRILQRPGTLYSPLYLHGPTGCGKSFLAKAYAAACHERSPSGDGKTEPRVRCVSAGRWFNYYAASAQDKTLARFRERHRSLDVFVIDDVELLATKTKTQSELLHTIEALHDAGKQVVITSSLPPLQIEGLCPALAERFVGGLVARMDRPGIGLRRKILEQQSRELSGKVRGSLLDLLASWVPGTTHDMVGALRKLDILASCRRKSLSVDEARRALADVISRQARRTTVEQILSEVAAFYHLEEGDILGRGRRGSIVLARQVAMYLARRHTELSFAQIGKKIGGRAHSTVRSSEQKIAAIIEAGGTATAEQLAPLIDRFESR